MKTLLTTTALVVACALPTLTFAQTKQAAPMAQGMHGGASMPGFLAMRGGSDVHVSDLMGKEVYARRDGGALTGTAATTGGGTASGQVTAGSGTAASPTMGTDGMHGMMATMNRADLDAMDNIGRITDVVLSSDGQLRALVIGIGGFLGIGARDVAVTMDQVAFATDREDRAETYVIVNMGADMLRESPVYDRTSKMDDQANHADRTQAGHAATGGLSDRTAFAAPDVRRDGYDRVAVTEVSSDMLLGKSVYGVNDKSVGKIDNLILDDKGAITNVIIDFGGFLGIGTSQVSVGFDELTILANSGRADVRVYVDATKEQVQAQPRYRASN
ncbi:MAG: PRC-barrel domain-containing protein [Gemmobacter sp.]